MAQVINYMEVGKEVFVAGIGGVAAGYMHFQFLAPQFAGQMIGPIKTTTLVDFIVALIIGIGSTLYLERGLPRLFGWGIAGTVFALGLMDQLGILPTGVVPEAYRLVSAPAVVAAAAARGATRLGTSRFTPTATAVAGRYTPT
ncbi:hypothetical protein ES702_04250 [subsurface metagenome]